jgi:predicted DNA-binding transcriptional regulator AlpA
MPSDTAQARPDAEAPHADPPAIEPLLVAAAEAARLCGVSEASWYRLRSAGKLPSPVKLGGRVLWRVAELRRWTAAGCPDLRAWQALENANGRR